MEKIFTLAAVTFLISIASLAQTVTYWDTNYFSDCYNGTTAITPVNSNIPGIAPADSTVPCITQGTYISDTLYFTNYTTFSVATVNSMKFDSIYLPTGLCWQTNKSNNTFAGGETGVIYISGVSTAPAGQYKIRIVVDVDATVIGTIHNANLEQLASVRFSFRVITSNNACLPYVVDTIDAYKADTRTSPLLSTITTDKYAICAANDTAFLVAPSSLNYRYLWSTGATTQVISVTATGSYNATITNGIDTVVSNTIVITNAPAVTAQFAVTPDPTTPHLWEVINQCTNNYRTIYQWWWGDASASVIEATPSHTYSAPGYYNICVLVVDTIYGCHAYYCDSSTYVYKSENQMVQVQVVSNTTGINDQQMKAIAASYYGGAVHFTPAITSPANISLYDMSGREIMKESNWTGSALPIDAGIAGGIYILTIRDNSSSLSQRLPILR